MDTLIKITEVPLLEKLRRKEVKITKEEFGAMLALASATGLIYPSSIFDEEYWLEGLEAILGTERLNEILNNPIISLRVIL